MMIKNDIEKLKRGSEEIIPFDEFQKKEVVVSQGEAPFNCGNGGAIQRSSFCKVYRQPLSLSI